MHRANLYILCAGLTVCLGTAARSQTPDSLPSGWTKSGSRPNDYIVTVDRAVYRTGQASAQLRSRAPGTLPTGVLGQGIRADSLKGMRIRLSVWVRRREVTEARFFARVDGPGNVLDFANPSDNALVGTGDWTQQSVVIDVPATALGVTFGVVLSGPGTLWIDDVSLEIVPRGTPRTGAPPVAATATLELERMLRDRYAARSVRTQNLDFEGAVTVSPAPAPPNRDVSAARLQSVARDQSGMVARATRSHR